MARIKQTARPRTPPASPSSHHSPPSDQRPAKRVKTTASPAFFKEPVLPRFDFSDRIRSLPSPIHRSIALGDIPCPPKHGRDHDWEEWLRSTAHVRTDSERPLPQEDSPPASRPKKSRRNKAKDFEEKIKEHKRKRFQNSWDSIRVVEGVMKFDNPHMEGMTIIPINIYRHHSMLDCEPTDGVHGERLKYTSSWGTREPRILEGIMQMQNPRRKIGEIHPMVFLTPFHSPHDLFPSHYYETIRQRFRDRGQVWGKEEFRTRGLLMSRRYYSEWAEAILLKHTNTLASIGLYDAIEVTSQHFYKEPTILKGFLEYWSPTTNSFHLPYGEMSITLWDLHRMAGLPLIGEFYDEFIPTNKELAFVSSSGRVPSISQTTIELFKEMSKFPDFSKIHPLQWLAHFSRGLRFRDCNSHELTKLRNVMKGKPEYSTFGELAAFLAFWLSLIVLPSSKRADAVRPTVFVVAGALAEGRKYSLAPPTLCSIYRALGEVATHVKDPALGASSAYTSWHYITGWLGVYFPWTFEAPEQAYVHPSHLPLWFFQRRAMAKRSYEWVTRKIQDTDQINFFQFRLHRHMVDTDMVDQDTLTVAERTFFLSIRSCSLPLREGTEFWREPYYPSRFARQFGYDQAIPADCGLVTRTMRCYGTGPLNWTMIWQQLLNGRAGSSFIIPGCDRIVRTTYNWMRWWDHQSYLVAKCLPVNSSIFLHPPRLKNRQIENGVGYIPEKKHASHCGEVCRNISLEEPIREIKPINTLEGWFAHGDSREVRQTPHVSTSRAASHAENSPPVPAKTVVAQEESPSATHISPSQPLCPSSSSPMTRSRARLQISSPVNTEEARQTPVSPLIKESAIESSLPASYKGKQVVVEEADEETLADESSDSSSEVSASSQYEDDDSDENSEAKNDDFEEGEVDVVGAEEEIVKGIEVEILPSTGEASPGVNIPAQSPAAVEEEPLDYGEYSPDACAAGVSAVSPTNPSVAISPRASIVPLVVQKVVVREIIFPTETTDLPTPTTRDSSTEARAPSLADMAGIAPPVHRVPIAVIPSCSGAASSDSVATTSSFANIPIHKMLIVKHSLSAIIHIFKNPDQWSDLDAATEILESSARMAKIDISSLRSSLLKFRDSIISLASVENITIPPEILEYGKQLAVSQERASLAASSLSKLEREHMILQDQLKAHTVERGTVQNCITTLKDRIAALNEEISRLEIQNHEQGLAIQGVEEMIQANVQSIDSEKSTLLHSKEMIASLESKLAGVPDQAKLILEEKSKHDAAQAQLKADLRKYMEAIGISEEL